MMQVSFPFFSLDSLHPFHALSAPPKFDSSMDFVSCQVVQYRHV